MKTTGGSEEQKRRAGEKAVEYVNDGDIVGLGTGSTAAAAIDALGDAVAAGYDIHGVPTSFATRDRAIEAGIPLTRIEAVDHIDVAIDGSDEINNNLTLIKGGGAAHAREKVIDATADQFIVVADESKLVETLSEPVPVSTLPMAQKPVKHRLDSLGATTTLRSATMKDGPVITDNGNIVFDCAFGHIENAEALAKSLAEIPGTVAHGLFVNLADVACIGTENGTNVYHGDQDQGQN
ncbi:ribose-5-phosphate isomerase RpiA [Haloquadratum walsbyi]|jgi:ribose 5-phosphate isomerase A|uniref:Ribose-5-phosphate isomerase A n=1 Tax=Haloquadratum walsbyi (strain DSM 16790 / HBSQ001) TaxID=362976 RepID=RPIA_HALWD|nr:ribose-5-phosphate isomerase RpiA [Haloquadratum walsbyi]Q18E67.1 RecName: Full=Ribose-5-phosphate isomerase A; AltName: Full=Phosphoriboisomerase A; Short=PRI [Haloquadratum walsbyi DSM 16790]CAJ53766.1 ribose-5-phosphate isomerase [Haloquadratum walsbyi DSM 16790]